MRYENLQALINASSSARRYFLSLPVTTQTALHSHGDYIHTSQELRLKTEMLQNYQRHCAISGISD